MQQDIKSATERDHPLALAAMEEVTKRDRFTFADVWKAGDQALADSARWTCYRWADRLLQAKRRSGEIKLLPGRAGWTASS